MVLRYQPLRPRVMKVDGQWRVFVPSWVFGNATTGTFHGPFHDWDEARRAALGLSAALLGNLRFNNMNPVVLGMVN